MITLNPFVENNKARINQFLNNLCEVPDFYDTLEMDQYMALSKKDLVIHITLNELYNTHSLLLQHIEVLVSTYWRIRKDNPLNSLTSGTKRQATLAHTNGRTCRSSSAGPSEGEPHRRAPVVQSLGDTNPGYSECFTRQCHLERHALHRDKIHLRPTRPFYAPDCRQETLQSPANS